MEMERVLVADTIHVQKRNFPKVSFREQQWKDYIVQAHAKRRLQTKIVSNRRANIGKPLGWKLETFLMDIPSRKVELIPEPQQATPDPRFHQFPSNDPLTRFKLSTAKPPSKPPKRYQLVNKAMDTEVTTAVGDNDSLDDVEGGIYERIDEKDLGLDISQPFDYQKVEEERRWREEQARRRWTPDSYLLAHVFDSCPLQGEQGLAREFGKYFPWMLDNGFDQAPHIFWHGEEVCPQLLEHWASDEFRAEKLFVPVDRSNATFKEVILLLKEVDELAAERKRAVAAYYCCFAVFYGQKPKQSAHIEHECFRHDFGRRIVQKPNYDHTEDFKYGNSVNTANKVLGFVKEQPKGPDEVDAYFHAWKRLAGEGRWWFTDKTSGKEWIAVPWFWKHTEPTEKTYFKHFDRCFAEDHYNIYKSRSKPEFTADPDAVVEIKASVLARKSACLHTPERSFKEVAATIWLVLFKQTPDQAKLECDLASRKLDEVEKGCVVFSDDPLSELSAKKDELVSVCRRFRERANLVFRATIIVFERAPRAQRDLDILIGLVSVTKIRREKKNAARRIGNLSEEEKRKVKEYERNKKATQREKKREQEAVQTALSEKNTTKLVLNSALDCDPGPEFFTLT